MTNIQFPPTEPEKIYDLTGAQNIVKEMATRLQRQTNQWAIGKLNAIAHNAPHWMIIKETKEDIRDNYTAIATILGVDLTERIKNF